MNTTATVNGSSNKSQQVKKNALQRGFTMAELLIVIVCIGLLAALAVPTINRVRDALADSTKTQNAAKLTEYMGTLFNGGVDTSTYTTGTDAIAALRAGITVPASVPGGATVEVRLENDVNAAAYTFTAGTASTAPRFVAVLGQRTVRP